MTTVPVSHSSDGCRIRPPASTPIVATYIPVGFECRYNRIGSRHTSRSPTLRQAGVWQPPKNGHVFPASSRCHISISPRVSCASVRRQRYRCSASGRSPANSLGTIERSSSSHATDADQRTNPEMPTPRPRSSRPARATTVVARSRSVEDIVEESVRTSGTPQSYSPRISQTPRRRSVVCGSTSYQVLDRLSTPTYYCYHTSDTVSNTPPCRATSHVVAPTTGVEDRGGRR